MELLYKIKHGSEDSIDDDFYYVVDELPTKAEFVELKKTLEDDLNPIVIEDGQVVACMKGLLDEVNNSIYHTFGLHDQEVKQNPITTLVARDVFRKASMVVRELLARASRTEYRPLIKAALKSGFLSERMSVLSAIDLREISSFGKYPTKDVYKFYAQQIGMLLPLLSGDSECFTKKAIVDKYPHLEDYLYRLSEDPSALQSQLELLVSSLDHFFFRDVKISSGEVVVLANGRQFSIRHEKYI